MSLYLQNNVGGFYTARIHFFTKSSKPYFPNSSFLEAVVPTHSSYAWRSITHGRDLIIQGSKWRVGNESLISIWSDTWILSNTSHEVCSPRTIFPVAAKVSDLIDFSSPQLPWKSTLIDSIFFPLEASIIKAIPLST